MIFGLGKKKSDQEFAFTIAELTHEQNVLAQETPAASYIFNNTLHGIEVTLKTVDKNVVIRELVRQIQMPNNVNTSVDGGVTVLAQRFALAYLKISDENGKRFIYQGKFLLAASKGKKYRDLNENDRKPPPASLSILGKYGVTCLVDLNQLLREEQKREGYSDDEFDAIMQNLMAAFDIRKEASSGKLTRHLRRLDEIIRRLS